MARNFDLKFNDEQEKVLAELIGKDDIDDKDLKDVVDQALSYVVYSVNQIKEGRIMASLDEVNKRYKEVEIPIFERFKSFDKK